MLLQLHACVMHHESLQSTGRANITLSVALSHTDTHTGLHRKGSRRFGVECISLSVGNVLQTKCIKNVCLIYLSRHVKRRLVVLCALRCQSVLMEW